MRTLRPIRVRGNSREAINRRTVLRCTRSKSATSAIVSIRGSLVFPRGARVVNVARG